MTKGHAVLLGTLAAVGTGLWFWTRNNNKNPKLTIPAPTNSPGAVARVDNNNQPWYVGTAKWAVGKAEQYQKDPNSIMGDLKDGASVIHSLSSIWGDVSGFFGGDEDTSPDGMYSFEPDLPADDMEGSNVWGTDSYDMTYDEAQTISMNDDYSGTPDSDNTDYYSEVG